MKSFFITSSGTDIGKTLVVSLLCHQLIGSGKKVHAIKPVITGWQEEQESDSKNIIESLGLEYNTKNLNSVSPFRFPASLSPDMAARKEGETIDFLEILSFCKSFENKYDYFLVEGVGGVMTPLTENETVLDLISELSMPAIVAAGSYLGSISHTLTALHCLKTKGIEISSLIVSESKNSSVSFEETINTLKNFVNIPIIKLPLVPNEIEKWKYTKNILGAVSYEK